MKTPGAPVSSMLFAAASFALASPGTSQAAKYNVTELPLLPGGTFAIGAAINKAGQVAGTGDDADGNSQTILWTNGVATVPFPAPFPAQTSSAIAINSSGVVLGNFFESFAGVFAVGPNIFTIFLSDLEPRVGALNDSNYIVGTLRGHPTIWVTGHIDFDGESLPSTPNNIGGGTSLNGINAAGVVVGEEFETDSAGNEYSIALRWTPSASGDITSKWRNSTIRVLEGLGGREKSASAINNNGTIVGWARLANGRQRATLWGARSGANNLGTLGGNQSVANSLNSLGDVAGEAQTATGAWHAVVWTHKHYVPIDLNLVINATWHKQITLTSAAGTNDRCMVLANGIDHGTGNSATFVLSLSDQSLCNNP